MLRPGGGGGSGATLDTRALQESISAAVSAAATELRGEISALASTNRESAEQATRTSASVEQLSNNLNASVVQQQAMMKTIAEARDSEARRDRILITTLRAVQALSCRDGPTITELGDDSLNEIDAGDSDSDWLNRYCT